MFSGLSRTQIPSLPPFPSSDISWPCPNTKPATAVVSTNSRPILYRHHHKKHSKLSVCIKRKKVWYWRVIKQRPFTVWKCWDHRMSKKWVAKLCWLVTSLCAKSGSFYCSRHRKQRNTHKTLAYTRKLHEKGTRVLCSSAALLIQFGRVLVKANVVLKFAWSMRNA